MKIGLSLLALIIFQTSSAMETPFHLLQSKSDFHTIQESELNRFSTLKNVVDMYPPEGPPHLEPISTIEELETLPSLPPTAYNQEIPFALEDIEELPYIDSAIDRFSDPFYQITIPLNHMESWRVENVLAFLRMGSVPVETDELAQLIKDLDFLEYEKYLEDVYLAWVNQDFSRPVFTNHSHREILEGMGIPINQISHLADENKFIFLSSQDIENNIIAYPHRFYPGSIQELQNKRLLPDIDQEGNLDLQKGKIVLPNQTVFTLRSLHGLDQIPYKENIRSLHLNGNDIREVPPGILTALPNLEEIYLQENLIEALTQGTFVNLPKVIMIELTNNEIKEIKAGAFGYLPEIDRITLAGNYLTYLEPRTFADLYVNQINLKRNPIKTIASEAFVNLPELRAIELATDEVEIIEKGAFTNIINLERLTLPLETWMNNSVPQSFINTPIPSNIILTFQKYDARKYR